MKILVIGLGTGGSRIADQMLGIDLQRHQTHINAIVVDNDPDVLENLKNIDDSGKFYFPKDNLEVPISHITDLTIEEVSTKLRGCDKSACDIILIVCGLSGSLVHLVPPMMTVITQSFVEPVFGLVFLPEDAATPDQVCSAVSQLELLKNTLHGIVLVDNQFWLNKARIAEPNLVPLRQSKVTDHILRGGAVETPPFDPYDYVNKAIAERIMILARAGDITANPPEMVLDTQEILQTITNTHYIALGYAENDLGSQKSRISLDTLPLNRFKQKEQSLVAKHERVSRMVSLAEQAVHRDISVECDLHSAQKALILVTGPEDELSMKGFMAIRKWISENIRGYELRSGDAPTSSDENRCGVLIVLAGIDEPPAVTRLKDRAETTKNAVNNTDSENEDEGISSAE
jgi:cell division GTPase FtsZ